MTLYQYHQHYHPTSLWTSPTTIRTAYSTSLTSTLSSSSHQLRPFSSLHATRNNKNTTALTQQQQQQQQQTPHQQQKQQNHRGLLPSRLWQRYNHYLQHHPLKTKSITAAVIFFSSDVITQYIIQKRRQPPPSSSSSSLAISPLLHDFDYIRATSASTFGAISSCYLHYWWNMLETIVSIRYFPFAKQRQSSSSSSSRMMTTVMKVSIDQCISAPFYVYSYYVVTNFLTNSGNDDGSSLSYRHRWDTACQKAGDRMWMTMCDHWKIWPVVHLFNFYFVPLHHRVLVQNFVLVGWSGYLSHLNHLPVGRGARGDGRDDS